MPMRPSADRSRSTSKGASRCTVSSRRRRWPSRRRLLLSRLRRRRKKRSTRTRRNPNPKTWPSARPKRKRTGRASRKRAASANDGGVAAVAGKAARRSRRSVRRLHRRKTLLLWRVSTRLADRMRRSMRPAPSLSVRQNRTARASAAGVAADGAADGATAAGAKKASRRRLPMSRHPRTPIPRPSRQARSHRRRQEKPSPNWRRQRKASPKRSPRRWSSRTATPCRRTGSSRRTSPSRTRLDRRRPRRPPLRRRPSRRAGARPCASPHPRRGTTMHALLGEQVAVLCVKGSGSDMATIEPAALPAVRLDRLRKLRARAALSDEDMVRIQRDGLLEPAAPNPSVETLLHAFLPHKFVDHTHANAILSIVDQPDGEALCAELYDGRASVVPYVMPGFGLAKTAADIYDCEPAVEGLILHKHGIFSFGDSAREAYERMIALVALAEERLQKKRKAVFVTTHLPQAIAPVAAVAPILRGACSRKDERIEGAWRRMILEFRTGPAILNFANGAQLARYGQAGVVTPDHTIRTKNWPLLTAAPERDRADDFKRAVR